MSGGLVDIIDPLPEYLVAAQFSKYPLAVQESTLENALHCFTAGQVYLACTLFDVLAEISWVYKEIPSYLAQQSPSLLKSWKLKVPSFKN